MTTTHDQLQRIKSRCQELLATAEKRTQGRWEASTVESIGGASIYGDVNSPIKQNRRIVASGTWTNDEDACPMIVRPISIKECDANTAFIASCAGPAEAGWRDTLGRIAFCEKLRRMFPEKCNALLTAMIAEEEAEIIAAWREELP